MQLEDDCRWIVFDAVGTLIFADPPVHETYHRIGQKYGSRLTQSEVCQRFARVFHLRSHGPGHSTSESIEYRFWQEVVTEVLCDVIDRGACFDELYEWFARPSSWRCYEDVGPTLRALRERGFQLAIASNFDERLHAVCDGLEGLQHISRRIISSEVGWRKPHVEFYRTLTRSCGGDASLILMIGDDPVNDVLGAAEAGLRAVLIERELTTSSKQRKPAAINSLQELVVR